MSVESTFANFSEIIKAIYEKNILLPDFQRKFVWKEDERQRKIVASVLAKIPIGSILLLKSHPDEFKAKLIGNKKALDVEDLQNQEVTFLLDGQQRITVLTNVFSDIILNSAGSLSDLVSLSLKRRFFLRIPSWQAVKKEEEDDLFGIRELDFPLKEATTDEPEFLATKIFDDIKCLDFKANDKEPYMPKKDGIYTKELDDYCTVSWKKSPRDDGYLIPLFLLMGTEKKSLEKSFTRILKEISTQIAIEIDDHYKNLSKEEKRIFLEPFNDDPDEIEKVISDEESVEKAISNQNETWRTNMSKFLSSCLNSMRLNQIIVEESQRARAIDIYENLNRGGVSLNVFDLIMAKVAKVSKENFYDRMVSNIYKKHVYPLDVVVNTVIKSILEKKEKYNAVIYSLCISEKNDEISMAYIQVFLDVLSLYCYNSDFAPTKLKADLLKDTKKLALKPEEIDKNCEVVCDAIDRAMFFLQTRCGIRKINDVNYRLIIVAIAYIFLKEDWYRSVKVHNILEAWYWSVIFSGELDRDQNSTIIRNMQNLLTSFKTMQFEWLLAMKEKVLNAIDFSNKDFLLMEMAEETGRTPKKVLNQFVCQYFLAQTYPDMFDDKKRISVFMEKANELEAHHIVPLGSAKNYGESTKILRNKDTDILNSPLNYIYITKSCNDDISAKSLTEYCKEINDQAKRKVLLCVNTKMLSNRNEIKEFLAQRYGHLRGAIKESIDSLLY